MNVTQPKIGPSIIRKAKAAVQAVRGAFPQKPAKPKKRRPEHGQYIYVYHQIQKNQIVYSLTRALDNNASLSQLPYNGKKTVPSVLRKDLWHPFATLIFPKGRGAIGLSVFQKLREYRKRHELEWGNDIRFKDGKLVPKKVRGRMIMDQKANSVADMAAVLRWLTIRKKVEGIGLVGQGSNEEVKILWRDVNDAEFAETWTSNVEHGQLEMHTNNRALENPLLKRREAWKAKVLEEAERIAKEEAQKGEVVAQEHVKSATQEEAAAPKPMRWFS